MVRHRARLSRAHDIDQSIPQRQKPSARDGPAESLNPFGHEWQIATHQED
jgi:hypothetical protein